jgi:hypothetical protein
MVRVVGVLATPTVLVTQASAQPMVLPYCLLFSCRQECCGVDGTRGSGRPTGSLPVLLQCSRRSMSKSTLAVCVIVCTVVWVVLQFLDRMVQMQYILQVLQPHLTLVVTARCVHSPIYTLPSASYPITALSYPRAPLSHSCCSFAIQWAPLLFHCTLPTRPTNCRVRRDFGGGEESCSGSRSGRCFVVYTIIHG